MVGTSEAARNSAGPVVRPRSLDPWSLACVHLANSACAIRWCAHRKAGAIPAYHIADELQAAIAVQRENRLGMELHGFHGQVAMTNAHDYAILSFCGHFQAGREP